MAARICRIIPAGLVSILADSASAHLPSPSAAASGRCPGKSEGYLQTPDALSRLARKVLDPGTQKTGIRPAIVPSGHASKNKPEIRLGRRKQGLLQLMNPPADRPFAAFQYGRRRSAMGAARQRRQQGRFRRCRDQSQEPALKGPCRRRHHARSIEADSREQSLFQASPLVGPFREKVLAADGPVAGWLPVGRRAGPGAVALALEKEAISSQDGCCLGRPVPVPVVLAIDDGIGRSHEMAPRPAPPIDVDAECRFRALVPRGQPCSP